MLKIHGGESLIKAFGMSGGRELGLVKRVGRLLRIEIVGILKMILHRGLFLLYSNVNFI